MNERVNLRAVCAPCNFGDDATQQAFERECENAREQQTARFAIAPRQRLLTKRGWLEAGAEIQPEDMDDGRTGEGGLTVVVGREVFERLVRRGAILEKY